MEIIIVTGSQGVGKSTLIESLTYLDAVYTWNTIHPEDYDGPVDAVRFPANMDKAEDAIHCPEVKDIQQIRDIVRRAKNLIDFDGRVYIEMQRKVHNLDVAVLCDTELIPVRHIHLSLFGRQYK